MALQILERQKRFQLAVRRKPMDRFVGSLQQPDRIAVVPEADAVVISDCTVPIRRLPIRRLQLRRVPPSERFGAASPFLSIHSWKRPLVGSPHRRRFGDGGG
jgi:hypothetical protein